MVVLHNFKSGLNGPELAARLSHAFGYTAPSHGTVFHGFGEFKHGQTSKVL